MELPNTFYTSNDQFVTRPKLSLEDFYIADLMKYSKVYLK